MLGTRFLPALALTALAAPAAAAPGKLGAMLDLGVPDGANASLVYRPIKWVDLHAGLGTNAVSPGVRLGASVYMLPTMISPVLAGEVGRYFEGDANAAVMRFGVASESDEPILREVGYDYANLHLGLHFGRERAIFFIHGGWSIVKGTLHNVDEQIDGEEGGEESGGIQQEFRKDPTFTITAPSARLGVAVFF